MTNQEFLLWPAGAPGAKGEAEHDKPSLTVYRPEGKPSGAAMVICPGGGYWALAAHEGRDYALFLASHGITSFVLKYRLASNGYRHPCMLWDAARAVRTVRARASDWDVDPGRIGIMGSSAGGHLSASLLTQCDAGDAAASDPVERVSSRPDLGVLCYPVITSGKHGHVGSFDNLLGADASPELRARHSPERNVTAQTPPCFVWHTWEDEGVPVENSLVFAEALRRHRIPFDLHVYQAGRHGIGLSDTPPFANAHPWARNLAFWLKLQNFIASE